MINEWPFGNELECFGLRRDEDGGFVFDYTEEEQQEIKNTFKLFAEFKVNPDYADTLQKGITARALSNYSREQATVYAVESEDESRNFLYKAFAAIAKAYSIYQLPVYLYDLACLMELNKNVTEAKKTFEKFLHKQSEYAPQIIDEALLGQYDIEQMISDSQNKVS